MTQKKFYMEKKWHEVLKEEFDKPYMKELQSFLALETANGKTIYPEEKLIFNALCETPFDQVKVVIVGQDPYHGKGQAHGLSFSVLEGINQPPSLQNIFKELQKDVGITLPKNGNLLYWARQGVLLLNATLTVEEKKPLAHYGKGWEIFTDKVIEKLIERKDPIVFLLWGKSAQEKCDRVFSNKEHPHLVLKAAHPSFYSVANFFGCKHFSKTNEFLKNAKKEPIDWQIT
ncbi:MAG: uracil-DNA glycosylase [Chlamydiae bacterium]|nr:uracil-DNA glycosylase [Chlamydiota bacterium]